MPRLAAPAAAALILLAIGVGTGLRVSRLEEHDSFCTSCHTVPEVTYFERAQAALGGQTPYADLSSAHYGRAPSSGEQMAIRCIDCHRGSGSLAHRAVTLSLGARDALIWVTGQSDPTIEKSELIVPFLLTAACVECHLDVLLVAGFNNHFHNKLPEAYALWRGGATLRRPPEVPDLPDEAMAVDPSPTEVLCVDCHRAHIHLPGSELQGYLDLATTVYPACVRCHEEAGHGPLELARR